MSAAEVRGDAYGNDPAHHHISGGDFVCSAPSDAPCRTSPTCECENWCGCDGSPEDARDNHESGVHCCMTTTKPGAECWMVPWVEAVSVEECYIGDVIYDDDGEAIWSDGPVLCDWADGIYWDYATAVTA